MPPSHIKLDDTRPRVTYAVGATPSSIFTIPFPYFTPSALKVFVGGVALALGDDFTVSGGNSGTEAGGTVTLAVPAVSTTVTLRRSLPLERMTDYPAGGAFKVPALNAAEAKTVALIQQIAESALRLPESDPAIAATIPDAAARAGKLLAFDGNGAPSSSNLTVAAIEAVTSAGVAAGKVIADLAPIISDGSLATIDTVDYTLSTPTQIDMTIGGVPQRGGFWVSGTSVMLPAAVPAGVVVAVKILGVSPDAPNEGGDVAIGYQPAQPLAATASGGVSVLAAAVDHAHPRPTPAEIGAATAAQGALAATAVQPGDLAGVATSGVYGDLSGRPSLGSAAALNVATSGNAAAGEVVKGSDTRLADARAPTTHAHAVNDVTGLQASLDGKAAANLANVSNVDFAAKAAAAGVGGGFVSPMTSLGDLIAGGAGGAATRLGIGPNGSILSSVGGSLAWASPAVPFGWSPTDKHSSITLTDENRIATGSTANKGVRAVKSIQTSPVYFEIHVLALSSSNGLMFGLMQSGHYLEVTGTQGSYFGEGGGPGWGCRTDGFTHGPSGAGPSVSAAPAGAVTMHAVSGGKYWYGVNGVWQASGNPAAGTNQLFTTSGVVYPGLFVISGGSASIRTIPTQWQYSPPSGFGAAP